jgi:hypothetical protein
MKNMKMNKWTMGLAAAGVVTLSSVAQAQDAAAGADALAASTTLSGYVSTGYKYSNSASTGYFRAGEGRNAFSLDVVDLKITDGTDHSRYNVELWMGPAASDLGTNDGTAGTVELMQANFNFNVAEGLDLTIGQFGTVVGAETYDYTSNKFYTHSWGFAVEPTHHTGILATYTQSESLQFSAGVANTTGPETNGAGTGSGSSKTFLGSVSYTFGSSTGEFLSGTKLYYGIVSGNSTGTSGDNDDYHYSSITLPELVAGLDVSVHWDHVQSGTSGTADSNVIGLYVGYDVNADLELNARYEMGNINNVASGWAANADGIQSITVGADYKIWDGVKSRIEFRNDDKDGSAGSQTVVAANLIYSF